MINVFRHFQTIIHHTKINKMKLVTKHVFRHVFVFLPVRSNNVMPLGFQTSSNVRCDESTRPGYGNPKLFRRPVWLPLEVLVGERPVFSVTCCPHSTNIAYMRSYHPLKKKNTHTHTHTRQLIHYKTMCSGAF
ncbi:hypothetical protein Hanom_Chr03g00277311 [Helianthus anomalus]